MNEVPLLGSGLRVGLRCIVLRAEGSVFGACGAQGLRIGGSGCTARGSWFRKRWFRFQG